MQSTDLFEESDRLSAELRPHLLLPLTAYSNRVRQSHVACSLSFEHAFAFRELLKHGMAVSGQVIFRAQYEALVRAVWTLYAANEDQISRIGAALDLEAEQAAKNLPLVQEMMTVLEKKAPPQPVEALQRFKETSWKALNSYVHAGIHPLRRHELGFPFQLVEQCVQNSNGLCAVASMLAAVLAGNQEGVHAVSKLMLQYQHALPPRIDD